VHDALLPLLVEVEQRGAKPKNNLDPVVAINVYTVQSFMYGHAFALNNLISYIYNRIEL
jgi:hypothetical protein